MQASEQTKKRITGANLSRQLDNVEEAVPTPWCTLELRIQWDEVCCSCIAIPGAVHHEKVQLETREHYAFKHLIVCLHAWKGRTYRGIRSASEPDTPRCVLRQGCGILDTPDRNALVKLTE